MRRILMLTLSIASIGLGAIVVTRSKPVPELIHAESVPADLRSLADETWHEFLQAHPARLDCFPSVTLEAAWELDNRAEYRAQTATLTIRVPGTPATLRSELIHEFAHHLEFTCPEQTELRTDFLREQGFPTDTNWYDGDAWETTPSEQYAEATVELVMGRRTHRGGIVLTPAAVDVVRRWAQGS